jgi:hypothetical protein
VRKCEGTLLVSYALNRSESLLIAAGGPHGERDGRADCDPADAVGGGPMAVDEGTEYAVHPRCTHHPPPTITIDGIHKCR